MALAGPTLGVLGTVLGMIGSFNALGSSGVTDPQMLSANIGDALFSTALGAVIGFVGLVMFLSALMMWLMNRRNKPAAPIDG